MLTSAKRPLFLRWLILNVCVAVIVVIASVLLGGKLHGSALVAVPLILTTFSAVSLYGGRLFWQADNEISYWSYPDQARGTLGSTNIIHNAEHLWQAAGQLQLLGLLCTVGGFLIIFSGHAGNASDLLTAIKEGAPLALSGTFTGIFTSQVLLLQHHFLTHVLRRK